MNQISFWALGTAEVAEETVFAAQNFPRTRQNDTFTPSGGFHMGNVG
jgi:hypothetical protein